jgi:hypothetical protein
MTPWIPSIISVLLLEPVSSSSLRLVRDSLQIRTLVAHLLFLYVLCLVLLDIVVELKEVGEFVEIEPVRGMDQKLEIIRFLILFRVTSGL